jgi:ribosome-binding factor A
VSAYQASTPQGVKAAQLADQIRDLCAAYFQRSLSHSIVTVTAVTLTPDLRHATAWVRVFPYEKTPECLKHLQKHTREYQRNLQKDLLRKFIPLLHIAQDTTEEDRAHIGSLLNS